MSFAPFDIVVVPFPYSDRLAEKRRPALVVSDPRLETASGLIWVAMVTSAGRPVAFGDVPLSDMVAAGLPAASTVRAGKLATVEPSRVLRRAGTLGPADQAAVEAALKACAAF
jgi:mRNA interferase MazF